MGCGALGTVIADTLVRAGVGHLRICDRDYIELNNLQRQVLFDEDDIKDNLPKAEAAVKKLRRINSDVAIEAAVVDANHRNIEHLAEGADLILDGTDNFETRYLINDLAVKTNRPWIYGAAVGVTGLCMAILPRETPCLRCLFDEAPPPEMNPTCDTAGVLAMTIHLVAGLQAMEAIKLLTGNRSQVNRHLVSIDAWSARFINLNVQSAYDESECVCCKKNVFEFLSGKKAGSATTLCGRNAVQVSPNSNAQVDLAEMARKLSAVGAASVKHNAFLLRSELEGLQVTLFADGRAIVAGTDEPERARSIVAKYFGA